MCHIIILSAYWMCAVPRIAVLLLSSGEGSGWIDYQLLITKPTHTHTQSSQHRSEKSNLFAGLLNSSSCLCACLCFPAECWTVLVIICSHVWPDFPGGHFWPLWELWERQPSDEHLPEQWRHQLLLLLRGNGTRAFSFPHACCALWLEMFAACVKLNQHLLTISY